MGVKGVVVVTCASARMWVGPQPAWKLVMHQMREVRCIGSVVLCNLSGKPLNVGDEIDVWNAPAAVKPEDIDRAVVGFVKGDELLLGFAATPLVPAAVMEKCADVVIEGADLAQTCLRSHSAHQIVAGRDLTVYPQFESGYAPVHGVRAFRTKALDAAVRPFVPIEVTRKQGLSLLDEGDKELIEALEYAGRI